MLFELSGIPIPPSMNNAYPTNRYGYRFKSKEFRLWEGKFKGWSLQHINQITEARREFHEPRPGNIIWIGCEFYFHRGSILTKAGTLKRNDTENRMKPLLDAIASALWIDDKFFSEGSFLKRPIPDSEEEFCKVSLQWLESPWMISPMGVKQKCNARNTAA